jgi:hypothetical protein
MSAITIPISGNPAFVGLRKLLSPSFSKLLGREEAFV